MVIYAPACECLTAIQKKIIKIEELQLLNQLRSYNSFPATLMWLWFQMHLARVETLWLNGDCRLTSLACVTKCMWVYTCKLENEPEKRINRYWMWLNYCFWQVYKQCQWWPGFMKWKWKTDRLWCQQGATSGTDWILWSTVQYSCHMFDNLDSCFAPQGSCTQQVVW